MSLATPLPKAANDALRMKNYAFLLRRVMGVIDEITEPTLYEDNIIKNIKSSLDEIEFELRENIKTNEKVKELKLRRNYVK